MRWIAALLLAAAVRCGAADTQSLDGPWRIAFDRKNEGLAAGWSRAATWARLDGVREIGVPSCWETIERDYEGAAWYERKFAVPATWKGRSVELEFGAVNYRAEVWIDGQPAGMHDGGYTPFQLRVGDLLRPGAENEVIVRVLGPVITQGTMLDGIGPNETPHWRGAIAGGIWQSVRLVAGDPLRIADLFVLPHLGPDRIQVVAEVDNDEVRSELGAVDLTVDGVPGAVRLAVRLRPGANRIEADLPMPGATRWAPSHPASYVLHCRAHAGADGTERTVRFGLREFSFRGSQFLLNGEPIKLKAAFWEGFYPGTLAFPPSDDLVVKEIRLAQAAGFNVLRLWRKPPPPRILELADELGMMIIEAPPIECMDYWPQLSPELEGRVAIEIREMIRRDRNHPSVIYWELFNEIFRPALARLKPEMSRLARDEDPTRMVVDESAGWGGGSHAYLPGEFDPIAINEIHSYLPAPVSPRTVQFYRLLGRPGFDPAWLPFRTKFQAPHGIVFVSEVGYGGLPDVAEDMAQYRKAGNPLTPDYRYTERLLDGLERGRRALGWEGMFAGVQALCLASQRVQAEGNALELEALRLNPAISGYCLHAYTDGDWILGGGILDLFRTPKLAYASVAGVQTARLVTGQVTPSNLRAGEQAELVIEGVNDLAAARGELAWEVVPPAGSPLLRGRQDIDLASGISELKRVPFTAPTAPGEYRVRVGFAGQAVTERRFFVVAPAPAPPDFAIIDPAGELSPAIRSRGWKAASFDLQDPSRAGTGVVVVAGSCPSLLEWVRRGGVAILLKPAANAWLPVPVKLRPARGNWIPVNHGVKAHPIFDGLPVNGFMGQAYRNVCANETIAGVVGDPIVGSISYSNGGELGRKNLNYTGPRDVWWGSDLAIVPEGRGRLVLSMLHLKENLATDPVAERIFDNLVRWASSVATAPAAP